MPEAGSALFRAIADFTSLTREGRNAETALKRIREEAEKIGPASQRGTATAASGFDGLAKKVGDTSRKMESAGKKMSTSITLPVVAAGGLALKTFVDFDTAIARTAANANATGTEFDALKEKALQLGADTQFSATQAADAMFELSAAGVSVTEIMDGAIDSVLLLAGATGGDLAQSAELVAQAMNAFGISADQSGRVADVLTQAANQAAIDITGLQQALATAGQAGATANQDLESVVAVIQSMTNQGVPAAQAGTAVAQAIQSMKAPATVKARELIEDLGLAFRNADGSMRQFPELVKELETGLSEANPAFKQMIDASGKTGTEVRDMAIDVLFGVEGMKAMGLAMNDTVEITSETEAGMESLADLTEGLTKVMGKDAADAFIKAHTEMGVFKATGADAIIALDGLNRGANGVAATFEEKLGKTTGRRLESLKGSIETLAIRIIDTLVPAITSVLDMLIPVVNAMANFAKEHPNITKIAVAFALLLAVLGPVLIVMAKITNSIIALAKFTQGTYRIMRRLAIGKDGGKGMIGALKKMGSGMKTLGRHAVSAAKSTARLAVQIVRVAAAKTVAGIRALASAFVALGRAAVRALLAIGRAMLANPWILVIVAVIAAIVLLIKNWDTVKKFLIKVWNAIKRAAGAVWGAIQKVFDTVMNAIKRVIESVWNGIVDFFGTVFEIIKTAVLAYFNLYRTIIETVLGVIRTVIETVLNVIKTVFSTVWDAIRVVVETVWNVIKTVVENGINAVKSVLDSVFGLIRTAWDGFWNGLKATLSAVWDGIKSAVVAGINLVIGVLNRLIDAANAVLSILPGDFKISRISEVSSGAAGRDPSSYGGGSYRRNRGGDIPVVPGQGNVDSVPALLTPGEFVIRRDTVKKIGLPVLNALNTYGQIPGMQKRNRGGAIRRYALGGVVGGIGDLVGDGLDLGGDIVGGVVDVTGKVVGGAKDLVVGGINLAGDLVEQAARKGALTVFNAAASFAQDTVDHLPFSETMPGKVFRGTVAKIIDVARNFIAGKEAEEKARLGSLIGGSTTGLVPEFLRAFSAYSAAVGPLSIVSGFRTREQQQVLYDRYRRGVPGQAPAARPGTSNHERGLAIDHSPRSTAAMRDRATAFGLRYPMGHEPWHVQPVSIPLLKSLGYHMGGIAKYHSGGMVTDGVALNGREVLARLERGEGVLSRQAMTRLASVAPSTSASSINAVAAGNRTVDVKISNPVPEPASRSLYRAGQKLATLGIFEEV